MSIITKEFLSVGELLKSLDDLIADYRKILGELLRRIEELRVKSEQETKLKSVLSKLGMPAGTTTNIVDLRSVKVLVNPFPQQELSSLETAVEALNNKITTLTAIRKDLEVLSGVGNGGLRIIVVFVDDLPKNVILKFA
ncbi:MAG: hypothetical protein QXK88_02875 [Desulfurococcaceae archaeon]